MPTLHTPSYMSYPFRVGQDTIETSDRAKHVREQIEHAVQLCVARKPNPVALDFLEQVYHGELESFKSDAKAARALVGNFKLPGGLEVPQSIEEWASWTCVANVLLNLDETITK